jgi:hypothetical protein
MKEFQVRAELARVKGAMDDLSSRVFEIQAELSKVKSELAQLSKFIANNLAIKDILLHKFPMVVFEIILKNLQANDILELSVGSKSKNIQRMIQNSECNELKQKVNDFSIYNDLDSIKLARKYLSLEYLSLEFRIGVQNKSDDKHPKGVHSVYGVSTQKYIADPIEFIILRNVKYLSMSTFSLLNLTELYYWFNY